MDKKQKIAIAALPILAVMMFGVYQAATRLLGRELAWHAGFWVYWPVWCLLFPWWMLGRHKLMTLFRYRKLDGLGWFLLIFPPAMAFVGRFIMDYDRLGLWMKVVWFLHLFVNSTLEEVLWRGVYIELFPGDNLWGFAWPTLWFALWHFAPGMVSSISTWTLMAGAAVTGACWGWLAMRTGSIRWSTVSHILSGLARL